MKKREYKDDPIVKALKVAGFSDEDIDNFIENGDILKSKTEEEMTHSEEDEEKNIENDKKHKKDLDRDIKEDEKDVEDLKEDKKEKKEADLEKSLNMDIFKAIGEGMMKSISDRLTNIEKSLETIGKQTPSFKGADFSNTSILEKSVESQKDENDKITVNIINQRPLAKKLIEKSIESADDDLLKSIGADAKEFLLNPFADTVGENLAMHMYKEGIKFVK